MRKPLIILGLLACVFALTGCNTVKHTASGFASGASEDYKEAKKIDAYLQDKLW